MITNVLILTAFAVLIIVGFLAILAYLEKKYKD